MPLTHCKRSKASETFLRRSANNFSAKRFKSYTRKYLLIRWKCREKSYTYTSFHIRPKSFPYSETAKALEIDSTRRSFRTKCQTIFLIIFEKIYIHNFREPELFRNIKYEKNRKKHIKSPFILAVALQYFIVEKKTFSLRRQSVR